VVHVYAQSLHYVFLFAVPVAVVAFFLALTLPQVKMRSASRRPELLDAARGAVALGAISS
jgi:hypothetical protein